MYSERGLPLRDTAQYFGLPKKSGPLRCGGARGAVREHYFSLAGRGTLLALHEAEGERRVAVVGTDARIERLGHRRDRVLLHQLLGQGDARVIRSGTGVEE